MRSSSKKKLAIAGLGMILGGAPVYGSEVDYTLMSLEELMKVPVTTITLTSTERNLVPAAVTHISREQIDQTNARNMGWLLMAYVPNFEFADHTWEQRHFGMRGIMGDRDDKYLMLVNGRVMNDRSHMGGLTEKDQILNGDINEMDVVRGPGSVIYGPGAVMGVISQNTYNGLTFQGNDVKVRQGFIDEYSSVEYKYGKKFDDKTGFFFYGGIANLEGASQSDSPIVQGWDWNSPTYGSVKNGEHVPYDLGRGGDAYSDSPHIRLHAQFNSGGLTAWVRYTQGGINLDPTDKSYAPGANFTTMEDHAVQELGVGYQQLTGFVGYKTDLTSELALDVSTSWDNTGFERVWDAGFMNSHQEQKWISKALLSWTGLKNHKMAAGVEYGYYVEGLKSWMSPHAVVAGDNEDPWNTDMASLMFEDQWKIFKDLTIFTSARVDKHQLTTDPMYSPRMALVWTPSDKDAIKLIGSQSLRTNTEETMRSLWINDHVKSPPEKQNSLELRYERQQTENFTLAASAFYNKLDVFGWMVGMGRYGNVGSYKVAGVEFEAVYRTKNSAFTFSHGYSKMVGQDFEIRNFITSAWMGYGYDLANWSNNVTKLTAHHQIDPKWSVDGSLQIMWGYEGGEDNMKFHNADPYYLSKHNLPDAVDGYDDAFGVTAFMNLGVQYKLDDHATIRLDAYNILGWVDEALNKDFVFGSVWEGAYRVQPPAIGISVQYTF